MFHKYPYTDFNEYNLDWVIERVKQLTADWLETAEQWTNTEEEWNTLYNYVHDYFDNLDVTQEVGQIINDYRLDGTLSTICQPIVDHWVETNVPNQINEWLDTNITQETGYVLDSSLTLYNAAAPAKTVGDVLETLEENKISWVSKNIINPNTENKWANYYINYENGKKGSLSGFTTFLFRVNAGDVLSFRGNNAHISFATQFTDFDSLTIDYVVNGCLEMGILSIRHWLTSQYLQVLNICGILSVRLLLESLHR